MYPLVRYPSRTKRVVAVQMRQLRRARTDFFQQNVTRMVDDVISQFKGSLDLWPTLIEICYYAKSKKAFPQVRVLNKTSNRRAGA